MSKFHPFSKILLSGHQSLKSFFLMCQWGTTLSKQATDLFPPCLIIAASPGWQATGTAGLDIFTSPRVPDTMPYTRKTLSKCVVRWSADCVAIHSFIQQENNHHLFKEYCKCHETHQKFLWYFLHHLACYMLKEKKSLWRCKRYKSRENCCEICWHSPYQWITKNFLGLKRHFIILCNIT